MGTIEVPIASLKSIMDIMKFQTIQFKSMEGFLRKQNKKVIELRAERDRLQKQINLLEKEASKTVNMSKFTNDLNEIAKISQFQTMHVKSLTKHMHHKDKIVKNLYSQVQNKVKHNNALLKEMETLKMNSSLAKDQLEISEKKNQDLEKKVESLRQEVVTLTSFKSSSVTSINPYLDYSQQDISFSINDPKVFKQHQNRETFLDGTSSVISSIPNQSNDISFLNNLTPHQRGQADFSGFNSSAFFQQDSRGPGSGSRQSSGNRPKYFQVKRNQSFNLPQYSMSRASVKAEPVSFNRNASETTPAVLAQFDGTERRRPPSKGVPLMAGEVTKDKQDPATNEKVATPSKKNNESTNNNNGSNTKEVLSKEESNKTQPKPEIVKENPKDITGRREPADRTLPNRATVNRAVANKTPSTADTFTRPPINRKIAPSTVDSGRGSLPSRQSRNSITNINRRRRGTPASQRSITPQSVDDNGSEGSRRSSPYPNDDTVNRRRRALESSDSRTSSVTRSSGSKVESWSLASEESKKSVASGDAQVLDWTPLLVGKETPNYFFEGIRHLDGWISEPNPTFPIDVLLGFDDIYNVYKVEIGVLDHLLPERIEVRVGKNDIVDTEISYKTARAAVYEMSGTVTFLKPASKDIPPETKTVFTDFDGQYLWLTIFSPYRNKKINRTNQIRIGTVIIYGYETEDLPPQRRGESRASSLGSRRSRRSKTRQSERRSVSRSSSASRLSTSSSRISFVSLTNSLVRTPTPPKGLTTDALKVNGDGVAGDPLLSMRIVRNLVNQKKRRADKKGLDVQATVCLRALQRLEEYEAQMLVAKSQMTAALSSGNPAEAEKQRLNMIDIRDVAFRVTQLDLLLDSEELRALGIESKWTLKS